MGDANVRRPVATRFEHGVDFGHLVHKSPFMAEKRDPLVLSNYIFELLEVNPGVAGFLIQLHPEDVDALVESVTAHAEKGAGTETTLYVGQEEEEEEVEEEEEDAGGVGAGGRKEKPHNPLMISVQKVRVRPGKGKGKSDGWFPQPLTHNTRRVCTDDPENKLPMHSHVPLQSIVQNAISMARVIGKPPPSGVAIVVISSDATSLWKASSTRADVWVNVWGGGAKYASKVKLWASWFCMDGGDEQAFLRSLDISANLNQEVRDVEEDVVLFQNQFLTCTVILTGDGKGMQAMGGAGSKCWLCKDPNGIVEQRGVESTSRWGAFLRSVSPDRRPGDYQHAACRILNGIAKRIETTLQALPPGTPGKAQALAALQAFKQALKDETSGIPLRERLPSASRATEKDFDLTSTKGFLTPPPPSGGNLWIASKSMSPQ